jgi:ketosteroid isomerase-like protein
MNTQSISDEELLARLDIEYQAAVKNNDDATMDRLLAEDFVLIVGNGTAYSKADLLNEARAKTKFYELQDATDRTVRLWGDTAVVTALLWVKGTEGDASFNFRVWYSDIYARTATGWRYVLGQAGMRLPVTT